MIWLLLGSTHILLSVLYAVLRLLKIKYEFFTENCFQFSKQIFKIYSHLYDQLATYPWMNYFSVFPFSSFGAILELYLKQEEIMKEIKIS